MVHSYLEGKILHEAQMGAGFGCTYEEASSIFPHVRRDRDRHTYTLYTEMPINSSPKQKHSPHTQEQTDTHTQTHTQTSPDSHTHTPRDRCGHRQARTVYQQHTAEHQN